jgi:hypothetical protein
MPGVQYPLNPIDLVLLATHESLRSRGYCGLSVMLIADIEGPLPSGPLRDAVQRLGRLYPALSARIRFTPILRRVRWSVAPNAIGEEQVTYEHHSAGPGDPNVDEPLRRAMDEPVDLARGPSLRVVHVQLADDRHRVGLRWAHPLMDLEGAHLLLRELDRLMRGEPPILDRDPRAVFPRPFPWRFPNSFVRVWQGRALHVYQDSFRQPRVVARPENATQRVNFLLRRYDVDARRRFEAFAREHTTAGPMRYSRAVMIGLARVYVAMATERGRPRDHYLFSHALPLPRPGPRPGVHGNHVTIPWLVLPAGCVGDWGRADEEVARQFVEYHAKSRDQAMWEMSRATAAWPFPLARFMARHRIPRGAVSCTGYRFDDTVERIGDAAITNLTAAGPPNCHPGWIVAYTTFKDSMSLALTFFEDYVDPTSAVEILDRVEDEIGLR